MQLNHNPSLFGLLLILGMLTVIMIIEWNTPKELPPSWHLIGELKEENPIVRVQTFPLFVESGRVLILVLHK